MRSEVVIVASQGRYPRIDCRGAIAVRHTGPDTVHLVSAAATPLGGDVIRVRVVVQPGARLRVRSVAAAVALPGRDSRESSAHWDLDVAGDLDIDPEPTIVAADARHLGTARIRLTGDGRVRIRERVQIGRTGERQGFWSGALAADADGAPLLRHRVELGAGSVVDDALGSPRAHVGEFGYPSGDVPDDGCTLALHGGGYLSTWQGERLPPGP